MKMEPIVGSETSAIRTQTPGNYPKRNKLRLEHGESLKTRFVFKDSCCAGPLCYVEVESVRVMSNHKLVTTKEWRSPP